MELTREKIEHYSTASSGVYSYAVVKELAKQLLAELDGPKGIMSTTEKEQSVKCGEFLRDTVCEKFGGFTEKNRELVNLTWNACLSANGFDVTKSKSLERQIAEEYFELESYIGFCELALLKYKAELEARI